MLRSRCQRLKLVIIVVSLCILMSYFVRNPSKSFEDDEDSDEKGKRRFSQDLFGNISGEFALDVLEAEVRDDMKWLRAETSDLVVPTSSDAFRTRSNKPPYRKLKSNDQTYLIVEYTNVFFKPKFCDKTSEEIFNSPIERCEYQNCVYSCAKSDQNVIKNADALLFHQRDIEAEFELKYGSNLQSWLSVTSQLPFKTASEKLANNPEQVWVLWNDEATWVDTKLDSISNLFNWTLSFRTGSEIHKGSYGFLKPTSRKKIDEFAHKKREVYTNEFLRRKNAIVWFVSNCKAQARLNLALEISKLYPVYIFGRCSQSIGDSESSYAHLHIIKDSCASGSECEREQLESFKYYLAFENTNCSDYVTEKVWRSLGKSIIPIVLQPARDSYARYRLPSKSIIHMQDFDNSPKRLVDYLNRIDASFPLYYEHLKWTSVYTKAYFTAQYIEPLRMCQFCRLLNTYEPVVYYNKIASYFNNQCYT